MEDLERLLERLRTGDPGAYEELGSWLNSKLRAIFSRRFGRTSTDDLVQNTVLDLLTKLDQAPMDSEGFIRWVQGYAKMERREWTAAERREKFRADWRTVHARMSEPTPELDELFAGHEKVAVVRLLIDELAPVRAAALRARVISGHSFAEIAAALGIPESTARSHVRLAKKQVLLRWEEERVTAEAYRSSKKVS